MTDEQVLIKKAQQGDVNAFRRLVERYQQKIYFIALDMTGNHHDAEDISQEVFIKVFRSIARFRGDANISSWMYRITMNTCIDQSRKKVWKATRTEENMDDRESIHRAIQNFHSDSDPEKKTEQTMVQEHIQNALHGLTKRERSVFVLRHYHDMPLKEIATTLQVAEGTIKSTLNRALKRLQKSLAFYQQEMMES